MIYYLRQVKLKDNIKIKFFFFTSDTVVSLRFEYWKATSK